MGLLLRWLAKTLQHAVGILWQLIYTMLRQIMPAQGGQLVGQLLLLAST